MWAQLQWAEAYKQGVIPLAIGKREHAVAVLQVFSYKRLGKTVLINAPYTQHCGLSIHFGSDKTYQKNSQTKRVLRAFAKHLNQSFSNAYIDIALPPEVVDVQPFVKLGFAIDVSYTYRLNLVPEEATLLKNLSPERRKNIRDAQKAGYEVHVNQHFKEGLDLVDQTFKKSGLHYDIDILKRLMAQNFAYTVTVAKKSEVLAVAVMACDSNNAYYIAGGTSQQQNTGGAGAYVLWESIKLAKEKKIPVFDFCGSSVASIERFFRGFGGELTPYFRIKKNNKLFDLLRATKEKLEWS